MPNDPNLVHKVTERKRLGPGTYRWLCSCGERINGSGFTECNRKWAAHHNEARKTDYLAAQQIAEEEDNMTFPTVRANRGHKRID